jgi:HK97 family phage prohead protease
MIFTFFGYASLFNVPDNIGDVVMPGAFRRGLAKKPAAAVKMLFQHDPSEPIGIWDVCQENGKGLYASGRLLPGVKRARELMELIAAGAVDGLSIGFRVSKAHSDRATGRRLIAEIDLWEISIVTFPMLPGARIDRVASRPA